MTMKGLKQTEEAKNKISEARIKRKKELGYINSPESRKKMSKSHIGKLSGMRGKRHSEKAKRKVSIANSGRKQSIKQIQNRVLKCSGENHYNWQGGKSFEPYDKNFNLKFKRAIRKRDNQVCMLCGIHREKLSRALDVHHINYDKMLSIPQNCISLCKSCHMKTNHRRKHWINMFQSILSERYGYKYKNNEIIMEVKNVIRQ